MDLTEIFTAHIKACTVLRRPSLPRDSPEWPDPAANSTKRPHATPKVPSSQVQHIKSTHPVPPVARVIAISVRGEVVHGCKLSSQRVPKKFRFFQAPSSPRVSKKKSSVVRGISERMIFGGCLFVGEVFLDCFACRKVQSSQKAPAAESESGKSWQGWLREHRAMEAGLRLSFTAGDFTVVRTSKASLAFFQ